MPKPPKPHHNCFKIFEHATYFHESEHRLRNSVPENRPDQLPLIMYPSMVLSAFASELYIKSLLCLETGKVPQHHNLKSLFRELSPETQKRLKELWNDYSKHHDRQRVYDAIRKLPDGQNVRTDLDYALDVGADAFRQIRYIYETGQTIFLLGDFPNMLRQVIIERIPWWASFQPAAPKPIP